jgi:hypothetical protein
MRTRRAPRALRWARVLLLLLVAGTLLEAGRPAEAQDAAPATTLGGVQGRAAASGLHVSYSPQGLLPIPNLIDLGAPDALATIASGPTTFARASVLDPGDILANPDAVLALAAGASYPGGTIPPYPYRITANSGTGDPPVESSPAPGLTARVAAAGGTSEARAAVAESDAPAVMRLSGAISEATTETDGSTVTVRARSRLSDLNLLGLLTIDAVVTDVAATSDGATTEVEGGTTVTGASVLGQPVTIDAEGIHVAGNGSGSVLGGILRPLIGGLNDVLARAGLKVTVAGPVEAGGDTTGQLTAGGLRIDVELSPRTLPALAALLDALPPIENPVPGAPSVEDLFQIARAHHPIAIEVARGAVSLSARPGFTRPPTTTPARPATPSGATPGVAPTGTLGLPPVAGSAPTSPEGAPVPVGAAAEIPAGAGIGGLVALALLSQPFIGDRLAAMAQAILGAGGAAACPREEP